MALALCADAGLVGAEVLAVDGTKIHADASELSAAMSCQSRSARGKVARSRRHAPPGTAPLHEARPIPGSRPA
jgi:hypothetical protein